MKIRPTFHGTLLAVILILLAMMAIGPGRQLYLEHQAISHDQHQLELGSAESARLTAQLQALQDPNFIEQLAREELGYVRPGETSYLVIHPTPTPSPTATATATAKK